MTRFLRNWNIKKHLATVVSLYAALLTVLNAVLFIKHWRDSEKEIGKGGKWMKYIDPKEQRKAVARSYVAEPSKQTLIAHGILGACFLVDLASYPLVKNILNRI